MKRPVTFAAVLLLLTIVVLDAQTKPTRQRDPEWVAPETSSERVNPLARRPELAAGGRKLFLHRCSTCHGDNGRGSDRGPDLSSSDVQGQTDGALFWKIGGGNTHTGMPSFSFLPEPQRWQLVMHLRVLGRGASAR